MTTSRYIEAGRCFTVGTKLGHIRAQKVAEKWRSK